MDAWIGIDRGMKLDRTTEYYHDRRMVDLMIMLFIFIENFFFITEKRSKKS
jgi:hypothetical protein